MATDDQPLPGPATGSELGEFCALGPFFVVTAAVQGEGWRPLRALLDPVVIDDRVAHVRSALAARGGDIEPRVAASTLSLSLFARLVSPVVGAASLGLTLPGPTLDDGWWRPAGGGPWPVALTGTPVAPDLERLVEEVLDPLADALARRYALSGRVLQGNVASAAFGAAGMVAAGRPDRRSTAYGLVEGLLGGSLAGTGEVTATGFVRSSCCLYYRVPGGSYCGDCLLTHPSRGRVDT